MLLLFQATATQVADSTQVVADKLMKEAIANADGLDKLSLITQQLLDFAIRAGERILIAVIVFIVGRFLISMLNRFVGRLMDRRKVDISIKTFVKSLVNILLTILLIISVVGALGVETTSFAALLASAGVAVGMALSGNLQNFAGGLIVLLFKPYKVGDWIESQGVSGTVKEIQIFYTKLLTYDNQTIILPNGNLANNTIVNVTAAESRRCDVKVSVAYSADIKKAKEVLTKVLSEDPDTIKEREHFVFVDELADSGINLCVRCWFKNEDFWQGKWRITEQCKYALDKAEIEIPFPQMDVHMR